ncbi:MAG TPA: hypothetical protein G4O08_10670 [Anaerolineae bacterium]|nr:hypothetical protein [Anaerolineae bacterium]
MTLKSGVEVGGGAVVEVGEGMVDGVAEGMAESIADGVMVGALDGAHPASPIHAMSVQMMIRLII